VRTKIRLAVSWARPDRVNISSNSESSRWRKTYCSTLIAVLLASASARICGLTKSIITMSDLELNARTWRMILSISVIECLKWQQDPSRLASSKRPVSTSHCPSAISNQETDVLAGQTNAFCPYHSAWGRGGRQFLNEPCSCNGRRMKKADPGQIRFSFDSRV
jgi:hypothetical protein